jgi:bacterioferritin
VKGRSVALEEYARQMINTQELAPGEVNERLRHPGVIKA